MFNVANPHVSHSKLMNALQSNVAANASSKNTIFQVLLADNDAIVCVKSAMINENGRSATQ